MMLFIERRGAIGRAGFTSRQRGFDESAPRNGYVLDEPQSC